MSLAELSAGPHATDDPVERARRQDRLQRTEATFDGLPVDGDVARAYGRIYAEAVAANRKGRRRRAFDLLIAATALDADLPLYTSNPKDFADISDLVEVVALRPAREHLEGRSLSSGDTVTRAFVCSAAATTPRPGARQPKVHGSGPPGFGGFD